MRLIVKSFATLIIAGSVIAVSCKTQKPATETNDKDVMEVTVDDSYSQPEDMASVDISKVEISGDILSINVSYSGGCAEHEFKLYFNGMYMKSLPPKVNLMLFHDNKGDSCRSIVEKTLKFNLKNIREKGKITGEIMVKVSGMETAISYKY